MSQNIRELPKYVCHKTVHALKIKKISKMVFGGVDVTIEFIKEGYDPFVMPRAWYEKHNPEVGGYIVVYEDGYKSYSPASVFEKGYSLVK